MSGCHVLIEETSESQTPEWDYEHMRRVKIPNSIGEPPFNQMHEDDSSSNVYLYRLTESIKP